MSQSFTDSSVLMHGKVSTPGAAAVLDLIAGKTYNFQAYAIEFVVVTAGAQAARKIQLISADSADLVTGAATIAELTSGTSVANTTFSVLAAGDKVNIPAGKFLGVKVDGADASLVGYYTIWGSSTYN